MGPNGAERPVWDVGDKPAPPTSTALIERGARCMQRQTSSARSRPASWEDISHVAALYHRVWHETHGPLMPPAERAARSLFFFIARIEGLMPNVVVADGGGGIVGFAAWAGQVLGQVFVDAEYRGTGVARTLMQAAEDGLRTQGLAEGELHCLVGNERARRFYERAGWRLIETITEPVRGEEDGSSRDFWVMRKRLD